MTGYLLERRSTSDEWSRLNDNPIPELRQIVDNLDPLTRYQFRVAAVNECGTGDCSEVSEMTTKSPSVPWRISNGLLPVAIGNVSNLSLF